MKYNILSYYAYFRHATHTKIQDRQKLNSIFRAHITKFIKKIPTAVAEILQLKILVKTLQKAQKFYFYT